MEKDEIRTLIKRLVDEANVIAPSINRFDKDRDDGNVTDEDLDFDSLVSWKIESKALLHQLSDTISSVFSDLYKDYLKVEKDSQEYHSNSIFVHITRQFLGSALSLPDSPLLEGYSPAKRAPTSIQGVVSGYGFIAMPMDPEDHKLVDVLDAVKEAAGRCGVRAERIDEPQSNEPITDRILESIQRAEFVIVDLTNSRPNVFFEAGYAHGIGKIPIYFAKQGTRIEFDLKDYPVLFFRNLKELKDSIEKRIKGLKNKVKT
ncbi:MAG: hypothetical protein ABIN18_23095 [Pseudomonadota bacterium]